MAPREIAGATGHQRVAHKQILCCSGCLSQALIAPSSALTCCTVAVCHVVSTAMVLCLQELIEDLHEECSKHGTVVDTRIPCPDKNTGDLETVIGNGCYGKVYCLMDSTESAVNIQRTFNGRIYDGRTLQVSYIQPAHFYMLPVPIPMQPETFT
jgi:hypothetical protein